MNNRYQSEFAIFMDHYLHDHPQVVADQHFGWDLFWKQQGDALPCEW